MAVFTAGLAAAFHDRLVVAGEEAVLLANRTNRNRTEILLEECPRLFEVLRPVVLAALADVIERAEQLEMFAAGEKPVDRPLLRHVPDQPAHGIGIAHDVAPENGRGPGRGGEQRDQRAQRGALPGPVRTEQAEDFTLVDLE